MMLVPRKNRYGLGLFDDFFNDPFFHPNEKVIPAMMKTDIKEKEGNYILEMDIPGFSKEDIKIDLEDGYLTVIARTRKEEIDEENGKYIHKERFYSSCKRSFYVGNSVNENDINANYDKGILTLSFPSKKDDKKEEKKYIEIQ